jgi:hypothetical protein
VVVVQSTCVSVLRDCYREKRVYGWTMEVVSTECEPKGSTSERKGTSEKMRRNLRFGVRVSVFVFLTVCGRVVWS